MLLLSLLAFNEDNVLTSDISEPNEWDQGHPASRSTYTTMLLLLSLLAFNDDNVLTSDVSEPDGCDRDRPASRSMYTPMLLRLSLLAFNDDNVLASDVPEVNGWGQDQPTIRCSYFSRRMGPVDATRFKRRDQPPERVVDLHRVRCSCFRRLVAEPSVVEV